MQELIKIETRVIGASETNAVSARELHAVLEIKKDFSNWIKGQINRAGLRNDVDYIVISQKAKEGNNAISKEYIITTDASKHIAMMSQGTKAKEVRDYFIAVEKEYMASQTQSPLTELLPVLQSMMQMMSMILKNQQEQVPQHLSPEQLGKIRGAINLATVPVAEFFGEECDPVKKSLYTKLNDRLGVPSYIYIQAHAFDEAITLINDVERRYELKLEQRKQMQSNINKDF